MRKRIRLVVLLVYVATAVVVVFFARKPQTAAGQQSDFYLYQLNVNCTDSGLVTKIFTVKGSGKMGTHVFCAGRCGGRMVTFTDAMAGLPAKVSQALSAELDKYDTDAVRRGWAIADCVGKAKTPKELPPKKNCEKPTPWFGSSSACKDVQGPQITGYDPPRVVTLSICGIEVFHDIVPKDHLGGFDAYKTALSYFVRKRVGSKICCDMLREAARTGIPCDPTNDIDCDGKSNQADFYTTKFARSPDINNLFGSPEGAPIDPFPAGLNPDDPGFLPPQDKCDCKWELVKGSLNCSPDGKQKHFYEARWRCPSTGNERFTRKYAAATAPCP